MSIKRYDIEADTLYAVIHKYDSKDGDYVTYEDHAAEVARLEEQLQALAAERDASRKSIAEIYMTVIGERPEWSNWHAYLDDIVEEVGNAMREARAQGAEEAIDKAIDAMERSGAQTFGDCVVAVRSIRAGEVPNG